MINDRNSLNQKLKTDFDVDASSGWVNRALDNSALVASGCKNWGINAGTRSVLQVKMQTADRILCIGRSSFVRTGSPQRERTILKGCSVMLAPRIPSKECVTLKNLVKPALQNVRMRFKSICSGLSLLSNEKYC